MSHHPGAFQEDWLACNARPRIAISPFNVQPNEDVVRSRLGEKITDPDEIDIHSIMILISAIDDTRNSTGAAQFLRDASPGSVTFFSSQRLDSSHGRRSVGLEKFSMGKK
ncbi:MAG: hypothetical protein ACKVHP_07630, partial [Verrucomicrobiales bacterium]